jgi:hypothetical protein
MPENNETQDAAQEILEKRPHWVKRNKFSIIVVASSIITIFGAIACIGAAGAWFNEHVTNPYVSARARIEVHATMDPQIDSLKAADAKLRTRLNAMYWNQLATMTPAQMARAQIIKRNDSIMSDGQP